MFTVWFCYLKKHYSCIHSYTQVTPQPCTHIDMIMYVIYELSIGPSKGVSQSQINNRSTLIVPNNNIGALVNQCTCPRQYSPMFCNGGKKPTSYGVCKLTRRLLLSVLEIVNGGVLCLRVFAITAAFASSSQ